MICTLCKKNTEGVVGPDTGAKLEVCPACWRPRRYTRCSCGRIKNVRSFQCNVCHEKAIIEGMIQQAESRLESLRQRLKSLESLPV